MATTHQSSTKQDILEYLLKHSQATAFELAEVLDVSPQAIRRHLKGFGDGGASFVFGIRTGGDGPTAARLST